MQSSRIRTARLLPVSLSMHCSRRGVPAQGRGAYLLGEVYLPRGVGVYLLGGYLPRGCTCPGGVPAWRGYLPRGVYLPRGCTCLGVYLPRGVYLPGGGGGLYLPGGVPARGCTFRGVPVQVTLCAVWLLRLMPSPNEVGGLGGGEEGGGKGRG